MQQSIGPSNEKTLQQMFNSAGHSSVNVNTMQTNDESWNANNNIQLEITYIDGISAMKHNFGYYLNGNYNNFALIFNNNGISKGSKFYVNIPKNSQIGFASDSQIGRVYTEKYLNSDSFNHFLTYDLCDNSYLIGVEDMKNGGDKDFQDLVVKVRVINCESN
jgi:hypothetical protein